MAILIDSSLWIDFTRARSPKALKQFIAPYILSPDALLADPIRFEVLRHALDEEIAHLEAQFQTLPLLPTPSDLWFSAAALGQRCRRKGVVAGALDLLISAVAIDADVELITFDQDFQKIAEMSDLRIKLLARPGK